MSVDIILSPHTVSMFPSLYRPGGLLVGQLNRSTFFEAKAGGDFRAYCLSTEGRWNQMIMWVPTVGCSLFKAQSTLIAIQLKGFATQMGK